MPSAARLTLAMNSDIGCNHKSISSIMHVHSHKPLRLRNKQAVQNLLSLKHTRITSQSPQYQRQKNQALPSLSNIFLLASNTISSRLLFNPSALAALSLVQADRFCSSLCTASLPLSPILPCNPYRVIKSGCPPAPALAPPAETHGTGTAGSGRTGW